MTEDLRDALIREWEAQGALERKNGTADLVSVPQFLAAAPAEETYIIQDVLPIGGYLHLFGRQASGKTRLLYQLAQNVSIGERKWCGLNILCQGPVLFLELDIGRYELEKLLWDGVGAGYGNSQLFVPDGDPYELNILASSDLSRLQEYNEEYKPLLVIVDTANDIFEGSGDNETVTRVIKRLKRAFPQSGFVLTNHERKAHPYAVAKGVADPDPSLGGTWERKASTGIRIKGINDRLVELSVTKPRLPLPWKELRLTWDDFGFLEIAPDMDFKQMLALWPNVPKADTSPWGSVREVCRRIAKLTNSNENTVYTTYKRECKRGVKYVWANGADEG